MAQSQIGAIGIDFGSSRSVIAVAQRGGVNIVTNEGSNRETPNVVVYGNSERFIGEQGASKFVSNFKNSASFSSRLLGISTQAPFFQEEKKWITSRLVSCNNEKSIGYQVNYAGENKIIPVEQVTAAMLSKLKSTIQKFGVQNTDYVMSVPSYYTEAERKAFLEAARMADIKVLRLFSESSAVALSYGIFRKKDLKDITKHVMFVDFGQSKLSCFVAKFTGQNLKVLAQKNERNLGVRDLDYALLKHYSQIFSKKTGGLEIMEAPKAKLRLLQAIEKQRKMLSAGPDAQINCEYLLEEEDFFAIIKRTDFEEIIKEQVERFRKVIEALKKECDEKKIPIDEIELIGGGTRIPIIIQSIEEICKIQPLRTLNSSECIARGCAMMAAIISPLFQVTEYTIDEINYYPIRCQWSFGIGNMEVETGGNQEQNKKTSAILFNKDCSIPNIKSLTFQKNEGVELALFYDPAPLGFQPLLAKYTIEKGTVEEKEFNVKIRIKLDTNGIVQLSDAVLNQEYWEEVVVKKEQKKEEKKEEKKEDKKEEEKKEDDKKEEKTEDKKEEQQKKEEDNNKDSKMQEENQQQQNGATPSPTASSPKEPETEIQKKKKQKCSTLKSQSLMQPSLDEKEFQRLYADECAMCNQDRIIRETHDKRNELESYIYEMRQKIQESLAIYAEEGVKKKFLENLAEDEEWLYGDGNQVAKSLYQERINKVRSVGDKIVKRAKEYKSIPQKMLEFVEQLKLYEEFAVSKVENQVISKKILKDEKYSHIEQSEKQKIIDEIRKYKEWMEQKNNQQKDVPKFQDPVTSVKEIEEKISAFVYMAKPIMNKPKPEPPKKEKKEEKTEEQKEDKKEENNKTEEQKQAEQKPQQEQKPGDSSQTPMEVE